MRDPAVPVVRVHGLRMRYGTTDVLHGVELEAPRGEVVCLLGPNGAGKTTTIEILEGFRMRSAGDVQVLGVDPASGGGSGRGAPGGGRRQGGAAVRRGPAILGGPWQVAGPRAAGPPRDLLCGLFHRADPPAVA